MNKPRTEAIKLATKMGDADYAAYLATAPMNIVLVRLNWLRLNVE